MEIEIIETIGPIINTAIFMGILLKHVISWYCFTYS